jgi:hypothetical protein
LVVKVNGEISIKAGRIEGGCEVMAVEVREREERKSMSGEERARVPDSV